MSRGQENGQIGIEHTTCQSVLHEGELGAMGRNDIARLARGRGNAEREGA